MLSETARETFDRRWEASKPNQVKEELAWLFERIEEHGAESYLEIGSQYGGSLYILAGALKPGARITSVDDRSRKHWAAALVKTAGKLMEEGFKVELVASKSQDAFPLVCGGNDALFIDASHDYRSVSSDYQIFNRLVRPGGLIAFHDTVCCQGVRKLWGELTAGRNNLHYQAAKDPRGIGILWKE